MRELARGSSARSSKLPIRNWLPHRSSIAASVSASTSSLVLEMTGDDGVVGVVLVLFDAAGIDDRDATFGQRPHLRRLHQARVIGGTGNDEILRPTLRNIDVCLSRSRLRVKIPTRRNQRHSRKPQRTLHSRHRIRIPPPHRRVDGCLTARCIGIGISLIPLPRRARTPRIASRLVPPKVNEAILRDRFFEGLKRADALVDGIRTELVELFG